MVTALNAVSIQILDKEFLVLVGPSGCGKSTTLRLVAGLEEISGGEIHIGRRKVNDVPPRDRDITLRDYVLGGARDLMEIEAELARLETAMAEGAHDEPTLNRYADAQARLEQAGGYGWRERALATLHRLGQQNPGALDLGERLHGDLGQPVGAALRRARPAIRRSWEDLDHV